jgi:hypothetical protein
VKGQDIDPEHQFRDYCRHMRPNGSHNGVMAKNRPHGGNAGVSRMCSVGEFEEVRRRFCEGYRSLN